MDSEMTQDTWYENEQKYFSRLKHADTVGMHYMVAHHIVVQHKLNEHCV